MIVFDLDDTLRNNDGCEHTIPDDKSRADNWREWQQWVNANGKPIKPIVGLFESLCNAYDDYSNNIHNVVVLTNSQFGTQKWLDNNTKASCDICEREHDDHSHPHQFKKEWIDRHLQQIELWVDDDPVILDYIENLGILTIRVTDTIRGK